MINTYYKNLIRTTDEKAFNAMLHNFLNRLKTDLNDRQYKIEKHPDALIVGGQPVFPEDQSLVGFYNDLNTIRLGLENRIIPIYLSLNKFNMLMEHSKSIKNKE